MSILAKLVDFGIEPIVFREFSKNKNDYNLFNTGLNLRLVIYLLLIIGFNLFAPFSNFTFYEIILSNILFTTIILSMKMVNIRELLSTPFKVNLKMHYPMTLSILDNLVLLVLIFFLPFTKDKVFFFVVFYSFSNLPGFILSFYYLYKKFGYKFKFHLNQGKWIIKESLPLFGFVVLTTIFMQIDVVILNSLKGYYEVGIYSAAVRLTMPLNIIPQAIVTTVFPILVKKLADKVDTNYLSNLVIKLLYFISFVIAIVFTFESGSLVKTVFGAEYAASAMPSSILYWCQVFLFFTYYSQSVLIADNRQHYNFLYGLIQVVINVALDFILITHYSFMGASIAKLIASFASFVFILYVLGKFGFRPSIGRYKVLFWSITLVAVFYLLSFLSLVPYLILSPFVIAAVTLVIKIFSYDEMLILFRLINMESNGRKILSKIYDVKNAQ